MRVEWWLLALVIGLSVYDFRTRRVPNWVTLPLLATGVILHFPGALETWVGTLLLFSAWHVGALGGGDAKLWMALLWVVPVEQVQPALIVMGAVLVGTALAQLFWRYVRGVPMFGLQAPGAWRVIPFVIWMVVSGF